MLFRHFTLLAFTLVIAGLQAQTSAYRIDRFAGLYPNQNGTPIEGALVGFPSDVAVAPDGSILFADWATDTINRLNPDGTLDTLTPTRRLQSLSQVSSLQPLRSITCVAVSSAGRIVFGDRTGVHELLPDGSIARLLDRPDPPANFPGEGDFYGQPTDLVFEDNGSLLVSFSYYGGIQRIAPNGTVSRVAGKDDAFEDDDRTPALEARVSANGLAVDSNGRILYAEGGRIRRIESDGLLSTVAGGGDTQGGLVEGEPAVGSPLLGVSDIVFNPAGQLIFADFTQVWMVAKDQTLRRVAGSREFGFGGATGDGGPARDAEFGGIQGLDYGPDGRLVMADTFGNSIRRIEQLTMRRLAGLNRAVGGLLTPHSISGGPDGSAYICDNVRGHELLQVFPDGSVDVVVGGQGTEPEINGCGSPVYVPTDQTVYFLANNRIWSLDSFGRLEALAGGGDSQEPGSSPLDADLGSAGAIAVAPNRVFFVASERRIWRVDPRDGLQPIAGTGEEGFSGDGGPAMQAQLAKVRALHYADDGSLYVLDAGNSRVRRITPEGMIESVWETREEAYGMVMLDGGAALISSAADHVVERYDSDGTVKIVAGRVGAAALLGDGGPATDALLSFPQGLAALPDGRILVADSVNNLIRILTPAEFVAGPQLTSAGILHAASFAGGAVAPESIISVFGADLAVTPETATETPLPNSLGGSSATVIDADGAEHPLQYFFAGPTQLNLYLPAGISVGPARLRVETEGGRSEADLMIGSAAPGLFSANATGMGVAAAVWLLVRADGSRESGFVFRVDEETQEIVADPVPLGEQDDQLFFTFYGSGFRGASDVTVSIGETDAPVLFFGEQGAFVGLDQLNVGPVSADLKGSAGAAVRLTADGAPANEVSVDFQ